MTITYPAPDSAMDRQATREQARRIEDRIAKTLAVSPSALDHQEGGDHYKSLKIQPVEYIHANNLPFIEGSVVKYVTRWRSKGGVKDLEKARHFLDLLIELETKE